MHQTDQWHIDTSLSSYTFMKPPFSAFHPCHPFKTLRDSFCFATFNLVLDTLFWPRNSYSFVNDFGPVGIPRSCFALLSIYSKTNQSHSLSTSTFPPQSLPKWWWLLRVLPPPKGFLWRLLLVGRATWVFILTMKLLSHNRRLSAHLWSEGYH
jgi:hypothetical protein